MENERKCRLYIVGMLRSIDVNETVKEKGIFEVLDNEHVVSLVDIDFVRIFLPVICKNCRTPNILMGENIKAVSTVEREMGKEILHSDRVYGECINCKKYMEAKVDIFEYPPGSFQIFDVSEKENCECQDIGNLNFLLENIKTLFE